MLSVAVNMKPESIAAIVPGELSPVAAGSRQILYYCLRGPAA